jgi:hypothetical protein
MTVLAFDRSRSGIKKASAKRTAPLGRALGWREVLRALPADDARSVALGWYRSAGYTADDFAGSRGARLTLCDALTKTEDWLENEHPGRMGERRALRAVRRRLEQELWP